MVKDLFEEKRTGEMVALGRANLEVLRRAERWCKHLTSQMTSAGMLAEMSGLPIGSFRISCPHATYTPEAMNLPMIMREFLHHNCRACPHHEPNGDAPWGANSCASSMPSMWRRRAARRRCSGAWRSCGDNARP